jgi:hypothetical protein
MNTLNRFKAPLLVATALALPLITNGCSAVEDAQGAVCCTEFKAGATIDANIGGNAQAQVAAQAIADFSGIASAAVEDVTSACRSMAQELDAPQAEQDAATAEKDKRKALDLWCKAAVKAVGTVKAKAGGTLTIDVVPPKCEASVSAKANCQASCSGSAKCDLKANPPKCTGGSLEVACKGSCSLDGKASIACTGKCTGKCQGSCTASGGVAVKCEGKCEGKCSADAQGNGNGVNAEGKCTGFCDAKCTADAKAPAIECTGSCEGSCDAACTGTAEVSAKCDGKCEADFEPLKCTGGKLEGGCQVDAKCEGNCDASVSAKAECTPPSVTVSFSGAADVQAAGKLQAVFEANLGVIFAFQARLDGMAKLTATITGNADVIVDVKKACIPAMLAAAAAAVEDVEAAGSATVSIVAATK